MYSTQAVSRPEISAFLEEARSAKRYYIGTRLLPVLGVEKRAGRYPRIRLNKGDLMRRDQTKRSSSGSYNETTQEHEWDTYDCTDRGLKQRVDDSKAEEMKDFFSVERLAARNVSNKCNLDFEISAASMIMAPATFTTQNPTADYTEANIDTVDVPKDLNEAIDVVTGRGEEVNSIVFSHVLWNYIRRSTMLQQYLYGKLGPDVQKRLITPKDLGEAFSLDVENKVEVVVGRAKYDKSKRGASASNLDTIWPSTHVWVGCVKSGEFDAGGVGRTLVWEADVPNGLFATETYRDEDRRSDMVRVRTNSTEKITNENCGHLVTTNFA